VSVPFTERADTLLCSLTGGGPLLQWPARSNKLAVLACVCSGGGPLLQWPARSNRLAVLACVCYHGEPPFY